MAYPPATPQRPLPGAYFATPAASRFPAAPPVRQPLFSQGGRQPAAGPNPNDGNPNPQSRQIPPPTAITPISRAARTISDVLSREAQFPEIDSYIRQGISSDYDIPHHTAEAAWSPFQRTRMYDIPDRILDQYNRAEVQTMMGLFAELNHAWVTIDNALYMWDYTDPNPEIIGYEEQAYGITAVKLVKPKAGVFLPEITHVLVVATTSEMVLLAVASKLAPQPLTSKLENTGVRTITLYQTKMSVSTRGINVQVIEGSAATGRIFFSGKLNEVYELTYQQQEQWFAGNTGKINHTNPGYLSILPWGTKSQEHVVQMVVDDSRALLYTLSSESTIRIFHMDSPVTLTQAIEKRRQECLRDISHMVSQSGLITNSMKIVSISPISQKEGSKLHLMATTQTGCRLFISATRGYGYTTAQTAPQSLLVTYIKFPPRLDSRPTTSQAYPGGSDQAPETSSLALSYTTRGIRLPPGLFFCFVSKHDSNVVESLFLSAPDTGRISLQARMSNEAGKYYEQACWLNLQSHMEDVGLITPPFAAGNQPIGFGNELAVQFDEAPQEVAVLTNTGIHIIRRRRLVDVFAAAIRSQGGDEGLEMEIKKFIRNYGRAETTATALAVACGQGNDITPGDTRISRLSNPETLELARKCFVEFGGRPSLNDNTLSEGPSQAIDNVRPSSRHEGLALYMARLVRSVWKASVITQELPTIKGAPAIIKPTINSAKLLSIQEDLTKLATFLEKNKSFIEGLAGPEGLQRVSSQQEEIALQGEHQALHSLQKLNSSIIEGISFVEMLFDERVDEIWSKLDAPVQQRLRDLTFESLFASDEGKDLARTLVKAIVTRNIANGSNVDTVAEALRRRCGSFCSADDVIIFKAQENLKKSAGVGANSDMGRKLLNESLKLFQQVAGALSYQNLKDAAEQFVNLQFYAGAISLALLVAKESDRGNRALSWVNENKPANDAREPLYGFRKQCYDLVHTILQAVDADTKSQPDMIDGRLTLAATKRNEAHSVVNDSDDELFQFDLYDWYLAQGWENMLLAVDSPSVVQYLEKSSHMDPQRADLLWRFHVHHENFYDAAKVQFSLAQGHFDIPLARRIEYLSRAKANASANTVGIGRAARTVTLYEVTELLDVANIQQELLQYVKAETRGDAETKAKLVGELDGPILDITRLYNSYADAANYYDICLEIYEVANHRNDADIRATWQSLLDQVHDLAAEPGSTQAPYEAVITKVRDMAQRLNGSETTFSPYMIIPLIETYAVNKQYQVGPRTWLPDLFLEVGFPPEAILQVLNEMWSNTTPPFIGNRKSILAGHMVYVMEQWYQECIRTNTPLYGSTSNADSIKDLLNELLRAGPTGPDRQDVQMASELLRKIMRSFR
ncbi:putative nucleoporin [Rhexocercosporidium sp. MPI-PUGE-AT-0058]|nr:putative nucleoporin [Rhexocercosporidium sp. MPI-PUGE-AT-0058]